MSLTSFIDSRERRHCALRSWRHRRTTKMMCLEWLQSCVTAGRSSSVTPRTFMLKISNILTLILIYTDAMARGQRPTPKHRSVSSVSQGQRPPGCHVTSL